MVSVICAYNNKELMEKVSASLKEQQDLEYELIAVCAKELGFKSASETLNYGVSKASGDIIIIMHQDIEFMDTNTVSNICNYVKKQDILFAGLAGISKESGKSCSRIFHGLDKKPAASVTDFKDPVETLSIDECFMVMSKLIAEKYKFTDFGNTWHMYGTDMCLKLAVNGIKSFIIPFSLWHKSSGNSLDKVYFDTVVKVADKYRKDYRCFTTLFGNWKTNPIHVRLKCMYRKLKLKR